MFIPRTLCLVALAALAMPFGCSPARSRAMAAPRSGYLEVLVDAPTIFAPHSGAAVRVAVLTSRGPEETEPVPDADVEAVLVGTSETKLASARTNRAGHAGLQFRVPSLPEGKYVLRFRVKSAVGNEEFSTEVEIRSTPKILLTTDKPVYQPGQTIHLRALALDSMTLRPYAGQDLLFEIEDGKGNKVFKRATSASEFGVAALDFELADEVNHGAYKIAATLGQTREEKSVEVKPYVLPKFKIAIATDKSFYAPGEKVKGFLDVRYFYGKPVAGASVTVKSSTYDVRPHAFASIETRTSDEGKAEFEISALPEYFVGHPIARGNAFVDFEVSVMDAAEHIETAYKKVYVSKTPVRIYCVPESGKIVPGVRNVVYLVAVAPDGEPVEGDFEVLVAGRKIPVKTSPSGCGSFMCEPPVGRVEISGRSKAGESVNAAVTLAVEDDKDNVLLRTDQATYRQGETIRVEFLSAAAEGTVFLDVIRKGQMVLSTVADVKNYRGAIPITASSDLTGAIELYAYRLRRDGTFVRDSRLIYVHPSGDLRVSIDPDKKLYRPGERMKLAVHVTDTADRGVEACLGIVMVDEAVYALQEMQPGLERLYFALEREICKPQYEICPGMNVQEYLRRVESDRQEVGQALFAKIDLQPPAKNFRVNTLERRRQENRARLDRIEEKIGWYSLKRPELFRARIPYLDLDAIFEPDKNNDDVVAYAKTYVKSAIDQTVELRASSDDGIVAWVNDAEILNQACILRGLSIDQAAERVALKKGWNRLLVRIGEHTGQWSFLVRFPYAEGITTSTTASRERPLGAGGTIDSWLLAGPFPEPWHDQIHSTRDDPRTSGKWFESPAPTNFLEGWTMPADIVDRMVADGFATAEEMTDLWGRKVTRAMLDEACSAFVRGEPDGEARLARRMRQEELDAMPRPQPVGGPQAEGGGPDPVRLREWFPETLYWNPSLVTDKQGRALLELDLADSITNWRLSTIANSRDGRLGSAAHGVTVFQDFFADIDFPRFLTQNDQVSVPVALFNYLDKENEMRLAVEPQPWFELLDSAERTVTLKPGEISVARFRIRVRGIGRREFSVWARGSKQSDAVKRSVEVLPDGKCVETVINEKLTARSRHAIPIPEDSVPGSYRVLFKLYPGICAQLVDGLDGMLRMPYG